MMALLQRICTDTWYDDQAIHTIIRNHESERDDFIFYSERLSNLVIEQ